MAIEKKLSQKNDAQTTVQYTQEEDQNQKNPLQKTEQWMEQRGLLKFFLESLKPENRQLAWD